MRPTAPIRLPSFGFCPLGGVSLANRAPRPNRKCGNLASHNGLSASFSAAAPHALSVVIQGKERRAMSKGVTYGGYLRLHGASGARSSRKPSEHDELLFVILHQTMELWMKQAIHEIGAAQARSARRQSGAGLQTSGARLAHPGGDDPDLGHPRDDDAGGLSQLPQSARHQFGLSVGAVPRARIQARHQGRELPQIPRRRQRRAQDAGRRAQCAEPL